MKSTGDAVGLSIDLIEDTGDFLLVSKVGTYAVAAGAHLPSHKPLSLKWKVIHYTRMQGHYDQTIWEDEQLGELCADYPRPGLNSG